MAESAALEMLCGATHPGFESQSLRSDRAIPVPTPAQAVRKVPPGLDYLTAGCQSEGTLLTILNVVTRRPSMANTRIVQLSTTISSPT